MAMTEEDPLSLVQVRYAKGEIDTAEYDDFLSGFLKHISFQQVPSLKIVTQRYATGEIPIDKYKEILSHLLNDIINYQQTAPLRIIHLRYAEGEIATEEFEDRMDILMRDIPAYPQTPPLMVLFTRFAKGEIDHQKYQEMLSHLATYCAPALHEDGREKGGTAKTGMKLKTDISGTQEKTPPPQPPEIRPPQGTTPPDPYRLNLATAQTPPITGGNELGPASNLGAGVNSEIQAPTGDIKNLGSPVDGIGDDHIPMNAGPELTATRSTYHITDTSAPGAPVTVLVKPEMDGAKDKKEELAAPETTDVKTELITSEEAPVEPETAPIAPPEADAVLPKVSPSPSGDHQKIKALIKQGKYQECITRLDEMLEASPDDYRSLFLKSIALFNLGKGDDALEMLRKAKGSCTNKDDAREIERIYNHIVQKGNGKSGQKGEKKAEEKVNEESEPEMKDLGKKPSLTSHSELSDFEHSSSIEKICEDAQKLIDAGDYKNAKEVLGNIEDLVKEIPAELMQKEKLDDIFAAKGFVLYQLKEFCEAKRLFKEATRINPKNETAIHYLNDIRVRDCNKFIRHV